MPTYAVGGLTTLSQARLTSTIASQGYAKSALLYMLAGANKSAASPLEIGRPNEGAILSGADIGSAEKLSLRNMTSYDPRIQGFKTSNTVVSGARSNMPAVANPTTASQGQAVQYAAKFNWMAYMQTPLELWKIDTDMALSSGGGDEGRGLAVGKLVEDATRVGTEEHLDQIASRMLYGTPTNQAVLPNDDLQGVILAGTANNTYGNVDRSALSADDPWQGVSISTAKPLDIYQLNLDANVTQKMGVFGGGINCWLCGGDYYKVFKQQVLARSKDAGIVGGGAGLPTMAKYGVEREVLRVDNAYLMHEPFLDQCYGTQAGTNTPLYTAQPNTLIGLNLKLWKMIFHPSYNMKIGTWKDISDTAVSNPNALINFIQTMAILSCDRPRLGVITYTNLS